MRSLIILLLFICSIPMKSLAQSEPLPSSVYEWKMLPIESTASGKIKQFFNWPTKYLDQFEIFAKSLPASDGQSGDIFGGQMEQLILVKKGSLIISVDGHKEVLEERSIALVPRGKEIRLSNSLETESTYFVIRWKPKKSEKGKNTISNSGIKTFSYSKMDFMENAKGGRRSVLQEPTSTLKELEMHITTLNEGQKSHDPHTHLDEEIIVVLEGEVEEMINGTPYRLGEGSVIFLASMDPHGIRNIGKGNCEYYAIRFTPE